MSKNGPDGTTFSLLDAVLDQDFTLLLGLAMLPSCKIVDMDSHITMQSSEGKSNRIHTNYVGVNGGPEEAKKCVCGMIDRMWEQKC